MTCIIITKTPAGRVAQYIRNGQIVASFPARMNHCIVTLREAQRITA